MKMLSSIDNVFVVLGNHQQNNFLRIITPKIDLDSLEIVIAQNGLRKIASESYLKKVKITYLMHAKQIKFHA